MVEIAAVTSCLILLGLTIFQIALISGAPLGRFAWGGYYNILPTKLRIASCVSVILYVIFAVVALEQANIINTIENEQFPDKATWAIVIYTALGILINALSRSKPERYLMTPIVAVLFLCFLILALQP